MDKTLALVRLGLKYLYRYRRRYGFLLAALTFSFTIVTLITSLRDGMYDNLYHAAQSHYAGDIVAVGYDSEIGRRQRMGEEEVRQILDAAELAGIRIDHTVLRTLHFMEAVVHFNGVAVSLRHLVGSDWDAEAAMFARLDFEQGPEPEIGDDGILLSLPTARILGARLGDSVVLETEGHLGQKNTGLFIVRGIVRDATVFGYYKAYVSRLSLNRLLLYGDGDSSQVGFFLGGGDGRASPARVNRDREALHAALGQIGDGRFELLPLVNNREEFNRERRNPVGDARVGVSLYTLAVYLSEVSDMLRAMNLMTYFLYTMMLLIIFVSAAVSYRLILHERTRELGVMRTIGFYGADLRLVLWVEVCGVGLVSIVAGFVLARLLSLGILLLSFSWFPSFEIFMRDGRLTALYLPGTVLLNVVSVFLLLAFAAIFPSFRASRRNLPELLRGEPL
ncbi:MAG: ABC transporter permease [Treponema sp.]|nr:ABC transporter permease [Treponema sp.]